MSAAPRVGLTFRLPPHLVARLRERFPDAAFVGPGLEPQPFETSDAEILLGWPKPEFVRAANALRWLQLFAAGTEIVDFTEVARRRIVVTNARGVASPNIAEHVLAMILHFNRRIGSLVRAQISRTWIAKNSFDAPELAGQSLVIIGTGSIGTEIAWRAQCLGMRTLGISRRGRALTAFDQVVDVANRNLVLGEADHVVACLPGLDATARTIDADWFGRMKAGVHFYNVGRGSTVNEAALLAALDGGHVAGAGLDVTDAEPLPQDHPFWVRESVLLTQHKAMNSQHYWERLTLLFGDNLECFLAGKPMQNLVDPLTRY